MRIERKVDFPNTIADRYLTLLRGALTRSMFEDGYYPVAPNRTFIGEWLRAQLRRHRLELVRKGASFDRYKRSQGQDWPLHAETMVGNVRLEQVHSALETVVAEGIEGDFLECGIWRGGVCIYVRAFFDTFDAGRHVWGADSFEGLPVGGHYSQDEGDLHHTWHEFAVPVEDVQANFDRYGLDPIGYTLIKGWFRDTLPDWEAPLAVLRCDGDMYEGTMDPLRCCYDAVSPGGFVIIDDYGAVRGARQATDDFRFEQGITAPMTQIDWTGHYWRKDA